MNEESEYCRFKYIGVRLEVPVEYPIGEIRLNTVVNGNIIVAKPISKELYKANAVIYLMVGSNKEVEVKFVEQILVPAAYITKGEHYKWQMKKENLKML